MHLSLMNAGDAKRADVENDAVIRGAANRAGSLRRQIIFPLTTSGFDFQTAITFSESCGASRGDLPFSSLKN